MQPLAFAALLAGVLLLVSGVTGSTVASAAKGSPDHANAAGAAAPAGTSSPTSSSTTPAPTSSSAAGGAWRSTQAAIAKQKGWNLADWNAVIQRESGGDPTSRNASSGAFGLGQFLGSTAQQYAPYGALSTNPVLQIKAMAKYIADRYGTPTAALAHEHAFGWY